MAIIEVRLPNYPSRDNFLSFFASRRRSRRGQPPKRPNFDRSFIPPEPPDQDRFRFRKRQAIPVVIAGAFTIGAAAAALLKPWEWSAQPETLESLVAQAKKMEDEYKGQDLSDSTTREKYVDILAGIFALHYPDYFSRQQLKEAVSFTDTLDQFVKERIALSGKTGTPTPQQLEYDRITTATTDNSSKKITVNVASDVFKQQNLNQTESIPPGWTPLKMFRLSLLHEFNHLVNESSDQVIFSIVDPNNTVKNKRIEGFRLTGINERGDPDAVFDNLHEVTVELLAKDISISDFGSYFIDYPTEGKDLIVLMNNLEGVLQAAGITHQHLAKLHKNSNLGQFLLILSDKVGVDPNAPLENRIRFGSIIAGAIERNDQSTLRNYINLVRLAQQN